jgi:hypothetical protein
MPYNFVHPEILTVISSHMPHKNFDFFCVPGPSTAAIFGPSSECCCENPGEIFLWIEIHCNPFPLSGFQTAMRKAIGLFA